MILDASALLAIFFGEPMGPRIVSEIEASPIQMMSAVNLSEIVMTSGRRHPTRHPVVLALLQEMRFEVVPVDATLAYAAAEAKIRFPVLNLGDCFCYALAKSRGLPILTTDADFALTDADLVPLRPSGG